MTITTTKPEIETLIQKRLASGVFADIDDVIYRALESQDAEEAWLELHRREVSDKIDRAIAQADGGECMSPAQSRAWMEEQTAAWRQERRHR